MRIDEFKQSLRSLVNQRQRFVCDNPDNHISAVLVPFNIINTQIQTNPAKSISIVFIRRSMELSNHPGNIAFPGGHKDPEDVNLTQTAIREANEEIGLERENIEIIGMLDDEETITSNFVITPILAFTNQRNFIAQEEEVSEIISIPLEHLLNPQNCKPASYEYEGKQYHLRDYFYENRKIWGATSRILTKLLILINRVLQA